MNKNEVAQIRGGKPFCSVFNDTLRLFCGNRMYIAQINLSFIHVILAAFDLRVSYWLCSSVVKVECHCKNKLKYNFDVSKTLKMLKLQRIVKFVTVS